MQKKKRNILLGFSLLLLMALIAGGVWVFSSRTPTKRTAVFLMNGQVYFGYLQDEDANIITLSDIYYLKAQSNPQSGQASDQKKISLVKLGGEIHGPESVMKINRDQIIYYETMRDDSKINLAIQKEKNAQTQSTQK